MATRVLIVDDTESLRELMCSHALRVGLDVVGEAGDGLAAVGVARTTQPDAIILDVEMPVMDGLQALPGLIDAAPDTQVVVFSSRVDPGTEEAAYARGAVGFFVKGKTHSDEVVDFVKRLFAGFGD